MFKTLFDSIKFAVEYKVLVLPTSDHVNKWKEAKMNAHPYEFEKLYNTLHRGKNKAKMLKEKLRTYYEKYYDSRCTRLALVNFFNTHSETNKFVYAPFDEEFDVENIDTDKMITNTSIGDLNSWKIKHDQSVVYNRRNDHVEKVNRNGQAAQNLMDMIDNINICTPMLSLREEATIYDIHNTIGKSIECNDMFRYYRNNTTSNTIHLACKDYLKDPKVLFKLCMAWFVFEDVFFLFCDERRRGNNERNSIKKGQLVSNVLKLEEASFQSINQVEDAFEPFEKSLDTLHLDDDEYNQLDDNDDNNEDDDNYDDTVMITMKECCKNTTELMAWTCLLAVFLCRVIENPCVTKMYSVETLTNILINIQTLRRRVTRLKKEHGTNNNVELNQTKNKLKSLEKSLLQIFFSFLNSNTLSEYWLKKIDVKIDVPANSSKKTSPIPEVDSLLKVIIFQELVPSYETTLQNTPDIQNTQKTTNLIYNNTNQLKNTTAKQKQNAINTRTIRHINVNTPNNKKNTKPLNVLNTSSYETEKIQSKVPNVQTSLAMLKNNLAQVQKQISPEQNPKSKTPISSFFNKFFKKD